MRSHPDESLVALHTVFDRFGRGLLASNDKDDYPHILFTSEIRIAPEQAEEVARQLVGIRELLDAAKEDPDGVPLNVLLGFYVG